MSRNRRLLFFVSEDWYFCSHRLPIARAASRAGFEVHVVTQLGRGQRQLRREAFVIHPVTIRRASLNPIADIHLLLQLVRIIRQVQPDIVHNVGIKPVVYASVIAKVLSGARVVNALAGLGFVFSSSSYKARLLKPLVVRLLKCALNTDEGVTILQNEDDLQCLLDLNVVSREQTVLIRGSGVDVTMFAPQQSKCREHLVVALPARLLRDKGVYEFIAAARGLRRRGSDARFVLLGGPDTSNPSSVTTEECDAWSAEGVVEIWGWQEDMVATLGEVDIVALPSYREGLPKSLLEAAACGIPIVTTDAPGCRDVVIHRFNGLLVPVRNAAALQEAIEILLCDSTLRSEFGINGRARVIDLFAEPIVVRKTMQLYDATRVSIES